MGMRAALALATAVVLSPVGVTAQVPDPRGQREDEPQNCELIENEFVYIRVLADGTSNSYVSGPLEVRCDRGVRIQADSAVIYEASGYSQLFGDVLFEDSLKQLTAERANYFGRDRRLITWGDGRIVDKVRNSVIEGDTVVYARANRFRPSDLLSVHGGDPHAVLFPPEREPEPQPGDSAAAADTVGSEVPGAAAEEVVDPDRSRPGPRRGDTRAPDSTATAPSTAEPPSTTEPDPADQPHSTAKADSTVLTDRTPKSDSDLPARLEASEQADSAAGPIRATEPDAALARGPGEARPAPTRPEKELRYEVDARRFQIVGDRYFTAMGDVVVTQDDLEAFGDSLRYDQDDGDIVLLGSGRIEEDAFELTGDSILFGDGGAAVREIRALGDAMLVGRDVDLTAPEIRIAMREGSPDRLLAVSPPADTSPAEIPADASASIPPDTLSGQPARPRAIARDFVLVGDSIEVIAPGEVLDRVVAMGAARGESVARDSLNTEDTPEVARRDWLEGNSVTIHFSPSVGPDGEPVLTADGTGRQQVVLDSLVATGAARSLYRMVPSDSAATPEPGRLALHYVRGSAITIHLEGGEVQSMQVTGQARGYHLEPLAEPPVPGAPDSVPADSADAGSLDTADTARAAAPAPDSARAGQPRGRGPRERPAGRRNQGDAWTRTPSADRSGGHR